MWGAAAIPPVVPGGGGFTFADPTPVMGMPAPGLAPVAPVIPGKVAPVPAASGALTTAAPNGSGAAPTGPQPVIPGQEGGGARNAISRGREALGRVRERVSTPGSRGHSFVTDFAAGVSQPNEGRPLAAFLQGFAGAIGSSRSREAGQAAAAAEAERLAYDRARDADETAYDRGRDAIEDERWTRENDRAERAAEYANLKTEAEIRRIEREAERVLSPENIINARATATTWLNAQLDSYSDAFGEDGLTAEVRTRLTRQADDMYATLLEDAMAGGTGGAAAGTTPVAGSTGAAATPTVHLQGIGTQVAPYTGNLTQAIIDGFPSGTWIRLPDPTSTTGFRDYQKP